MDKFNKATTLCFSGHRTEKLNCDIYLLKRKLVFIIDKYIKNGYDTFLTGGCYGFDFIAFSIIERAKNKYPHIKNIVVSPFKGQESKWSKEEIEKYEFLMPKADKIIYISNSYQWGVFHKRNRFMVDNSSVLLCYSNGTGGSEYTLNYAKKMGIETINLFNEME